MQVSDLNEAQRHQLDEMALELMTMGAMWGMDADNRLRIVKLGMHPTASIKSAADLIREAMGDFPKNTAEIKPSTFNDFLNTLE